MLLRAVSVVALWFTTASYGVRPDSLQADWCDLVDSTNVQNIVACRLYRLRSDGSDGFSPRLIRQKSTVSAHEESLRVEDWPAASYWITCVNSLGRESCLSNGVALGSTVSVPQLRPRPWRLKSLDLQGRVMAPGPSGHYYGRRDTVVIR